MKFQGRRELHKITEYRSNCVYRTVRVSDVWIDIFPETTAPDEHIFTSLSTNKMMELGHNGTFRSVADDTSTLVRIEE